MVVYGLIGYPLSHSKSVEYFKTKFEEENVMDYTYRLFPIPSLNDLRFVIQTPGLSGFNVTIPYKESILSCLDELDEKAAGIGAVNTVTITRNNDMIFLKGYNTDADGFLASADFSACKKAIILGTGGASKAVQYALKSLGIPFLLVSVKSIPGKSISYDKLDAQIMASHDLIINTTPLGMFPDIASFPPIPYHLLTSGHFLYDLVYNPEMTQFLAKGTEKNTKVQNGLKMLMLQAEKAYSIWTKD